MANATRELARQLLGFNTINPPGNEADCMRFLPTGYANAASRLRCRRSAKGAAT